MQRYKEFRVNCYTYDPSDAEDLPIITPADALKGGLAYGNNAYGKASLGYLAMKDLTRRRAVQKMSAHLSWIRWHGKHPIPWDFFYSFDDAAEKDLNWFWNNWFFTNNYLDIAIDKVEGNNVSIRNIGGFVMPFDLIIHYSDGSSDLRHQTPAVWSKDQKNVTITNVPGRRKNNPISGNKWRYLCRFRSFE